MAGAVSSFVGPNRPPDRDAHAGGSAGLLGGAAPVFVVAGHAGTPARVIGAMLLGEAIAIGLMVAVAEAFFA